MKFFLSRVLAVWCLLTFAAVSTNAEGIIGGKGIPRPHSAPIPAEITFEYGQYKEHSVQVILQQDGRLTLSVWLPENEALGPSGDDPLNFLKKEVEKIYASRDGVLIRSGMLLRFEGGYPIWGPHTSLVRSGGYKRLLFGERATIRDRTLLVWGSATRPPFYPYILVAPR